MASEQSKKRWNVFSVKCCNPFKEENHRKSVKNTRNVTEWMCSLHCGIEMGMKICDRCRKRLSSANKTQFKQTNVLAGTSKDDDDDVFVDTETSIDYLNKSLDLIGESPLKKNRIQVKTYVTKKVDKIKTCLEKHLIPLKETESEVLEKNTSVESEMLQQLKHKFSQTSKRSQSITILSVLPYSWSCKRIEDEFGVSNYTARSVKKLVREKGIMSSPNPKPGKTLPESTAQLVVDFYNEDDVSRMMPGKKDFVTIRNKGSKVQAQKRLVLANISEIYQLFKQKHPSLHIGFSKFCELRPKNCILAGKSGTHTVCVCTVHQNMKLMINGVGLQNIVLDGYDTPLKSYHDCLAKIMCNPPSPNCYINTCEECPGLMPLKEALTKRFEEEVIEEVTYKQWVTVDRCVMETVIKSSDDFIENFMEALLKLKTHCFITNQQKAYYMESKENLTEGQVVINCDFAENYSFMVQDEVQSYHWTTSQATLHPFIVYYKWEGKIKHLQYVFISDCLEHNTVAFYVFQRKLLLILKRSLPFNLTQIIYFSDGSASQYKNKKNFHNLCLHKTDFGIEAEWQFFATSHGKSACDGLGGTVKRLAAKASLQRPYAHQILTPKQLYDFAASSIPGIDFEYCTVDDYKEVERTLLLRHNESKRIVGTQQLHSFWPISENQLLVKHYQYSEHKYTERVTALDYITPTDLAKIESGFVTIIYEASWWLGCILAKNIASSEYKVSFLHPKGPASSFFYPQPSDILNVPGETFLQKVEPVTATGRVYTLSKEEMKLSSLRLEQMLKDKL